MQLQDFGDEDFVSRYEKLKAKYCVRDPQTLQPRVFQIHTSMIEHATMEDGAARGQKEAFIDHMVEKQKQNPNAKNPDPLEITVQYEADKPWTHSPEAYVEWYDNQQRRPDSPDFFHSKVWAHQHLFESRRRLAIHFKGRLDLENSYMWHNCYVSVNMPKDVQSELSAIHNFIAHDVNKSDMIDIIMKIRILWTEEGCFESRRSNSTEVKRKKHRILMSVGFKDSNHGANPWLIATSQQDLFDGLVKMAEMHSAGQVLGQKSKKSSGSPSKKRKVGMAGKAKAVDWHQTFGDTQSGSPLPSEVYKNLGWVKPGQDSKNVLDFMKRVISRTNDIKTFLDNVTKYKRMKYLRMQLRTQVRASAVYFVLECCFIHVINQTSS